MDLWYIDAFAGSGDREAERQVGGIFEGREIETVIETLDGSARRALKIEPPFLDPHLFEWAPLGSARNVCIFHPDHRFSKQSRIEAHDLAGETIVDIDPQFAAHQMNFNALRFAGVEPNILVEFDCNGNEAGYVSADLGISITNEIIAREYAAFHLGIKPVEPSALYHYVAIWQKGRTFSNTLNVSLQAIVSAFAPKMSAAA